MSASAVSFHSNQQPHCEASKLYCLAAASHHNHSGYRDRAAAVAMAESQPPYIITTAAIMMTTKKMTTSHSTIPSMRMTGFLLLDRGRSDWQFR